MGKKIQVSIPRIPWKCDEHNQDKKTCIACIAKSVARDYGDALDYLADK